MGFYCLLFLISLTFALCLTPIVRRCATVWGAVDWPDNHRRIHTQPMPRLGGLAVFLAFLLTLLCIPLSGSRISHEFHENWGQVLALLTPATLIFLTGVYDDFRGAVPSLKLLAQLAAAAMLYLSGFSITSLSLPFGGSAEIPAALSFPLTAAWVVGVTNAFNLIDGLDGLAAGASIFALLSLFICSLSQGYPVVSFMSVALAGATLGFLRYNFNPATIFLGDSGSLLLGFMAAALSLSSAQKGATMVAIAIPLVSFGLPITEVGVSVLRRFLSGQPLFQSDRGHIHHMLLRRGWNHRQTVILLYAVCALFALFGLMLLNPRRNLTAVIFIMMGLGIVLGVQHLRYVEFNALKCRLAGGLSRLRRALAADIKVQRSRSELRQAENPDQLFAALSELLEASDFDSMILEVGDPGPATSLKGNLVAVGDPAGWRWNWVREQVDPAEVFASSRFWSLRIPLCADAGEPFGAILCYRHLAKGAFAMDLALICGLLQRDLSSALRRLQRRNQIVFQPQAARLSLSERIGKFQFPLLEPDRPSSGD